MSESLIVPLPRDPNNILILDGTINQTVVHTFTNGCCHSLASVVSRLTGWPIVILIGSSLWYPLHLGCQMPDGRILDIRGTFTPEQWQHSFDGLPLVTDPQIDYDHPWASPEFIDGINQAEHEYDPPNYKLASIYAPILLAQIEEMP